MSQTTKTTLVCDPCGAEPARTVTVSLDGKAWESERCEDGYTALADELAPFIDAARPAGGKPRAKRPAIARRRAEATRAWAKEQGLDVGDRGRIPASVVEKYNAAHGGRL